MTYVSAGSYYPLGSWLSVSDRERAIWVLERRASPGGGVLDQYLCIGESLTLNPEIHTLSRTLIVHGFCSGFSSLNLHHRLIQFLKQGPAYKKEEPDPDKGSNHQWVKISNKGSQSWFYSRKYIYMILSIFYLPFLVKNIYIPDCKISLASFV